MSALALTKNELRLVGARLQSLLPPGPRPLSAEDVLEVAALVEKTKAMIAASAQTVERGRLVLSWRLPKDLIPTQNDLRGIKPWRLKKIKAALHDSLVATLHVWPNALTHGSAKRRWVRTTRFTTQEPDELSCDGTGFKTAIDVMTACGVIHSDKREGLHREPCWQKCKPGGTSGLVELFMFAEEQAAAPAPAFVPVVQVSHVPGIMTAMLKNGGVK